MCGITGFIGKTESHPVGEQLLQAMTDQLAHRGPDGGAIWKNGMAGLGHRRLAIIDLHTGHQPMWDVAREQVIVFNGEIYNHLEIRRELEKLGHTFQTSSDTEIIPAAIKEWGIEKGLLRLRGMFAFALYNTKTGAMLLARDRTGIKPLYWTRQNHVIYFASEAKSLLNTNIAARKLDAVSLHDYLQTGYAISPRTAWSEIHFLPPGSWMEIKPDGERSGTYWQWTAKPEDRFTEAQWLEQFETVFSDSLRCHLLSDVPLGAFLSGGIDSSLVVSMLSSQHVKGLNTFNISFDEPEFDETPFAQEVADKYQTNHQQILVSLRNADPEILSRCIEQFDEPFGDTASLPNYLLSQATAQKVKVVISGDGGDEILGGYPIYQRFKQLQTLTRLQWADPAVGHVLKRLSNLPIPLLQKVYSAWDHAQGTSAQRLIKAIRLRAENEIFYTDAFKEAALAEGHTHQRTEKYLQSDIKDPIDQILTFEMRLRLNSGYLRKTDITSSAHGLETRVPFLDNEMLAFAERLPSKWKVHNGRAKYLGYKLAEKYLPSNIINRKKHGFNFPFDHWSSAEPMKTYLHDTLLNPNARWRELLQDNAIREPWAVFTKQRQGGPLGRYGAYARIYSILSLELWLQKWGATL
jgi:asparagine synthase (glutamine-hydrolysing)